MTDLKSEKVFIDYLKNQPDDTIIQFYHDVEWTLFPVLVLEEYKRRFKRNDQSIVEKIKIQTELAKNKGIILKKLAKIKGAKLNQILLEQASVAKSKGVSAKKIGKNASLHVLQNTKKMTKSKSQKNLELLEKLAELYKAKVITSKEFQIKKKELLSKI